MPAFEGVWLVNDEGVPHLVPNNPGVIHSFEVRGWQKTDLPVNLDSDDPEFIEALEKLQAEDAESKPAKTKKSAEAKSATEQEKEDK